MTNEQIVDAVVLLVIAEGGNGFKAADLERWAASRLMVNRTSIQARFDEGDGHGILRLQHLVAEGLRERGIEPTPLRSLDRQPTRRDPLGLPKALRTISQMAKSRGFEKVPTRSDLEDFALANPDSPTPSRIAGYYPGLSEAEAIRFFQQDLAEVMNVSPEVVNPLRGRKISSQTNWTPETMLASILQVVEEEGLTTYPTARAMASYAREGRSAGLNIIQRRYESSNGTGLKALQIDIAIAKSWPPPGRSVGNDSLA